MENVLWSALIFVLFFVGLAIRIILLKGGEFRGSCSSQNVTGDDSCSICGRTDRSGCDGYNDAMQAAIDAESMKK